MSRGAGEAPALMQLIERAINGVELPDYAGVPGLAR